MAEPGRRHYLPHVASAVPQVAVVDDEEPVRRGLERLLRSSGLAVASFSSGQAFLESLAGGYPDCLLLDLHMPGMDGFSVLDRLGAECKAIPVIVVTGYETQGSRDRARELGVAAYLRKPVDGDVLLDAIRTCLSGT